MHSAILLPVEGPVCVGSVESVATGTAEAKSRKPKDPVSISTLSIVEQFDVAFVFGVQIVTFTMGKLRTANGADETRTGTVLSAVFAVGIAEGSGVLADVTPVVPVGAFAGAWVVVSPVVDAEDPPPPPPHALRLIPSIATIAHANLRIVSVLFIASLPRSSPVGAIEANTRDP